MDFGEEIAARLRKERSRNKERNKIRKRSRTRNRASRQGSASRRRRSARGSRAPSPRKQQPNRASAAAQNDAIQEKWGDGNVEDTRKNNNGDDRAWSTTGQDDVYDVSPGWQPAGGPVGRDQNNDGNGNQVRAWQPDDAMAGRRPSTPVEIEDTVNREYDQGGFVANAADDRGIQW